MEHISFAQSSFRGLLLLIVISHLKIQIASCVKGVFRDTQRGRMHDFEGRSFTLLGGVPPVSHLSFSCHLFTFLASQPDGGELGICGIVITVLSYILVIVTFPFSLFFCLKVSEYITQDRLNVRH